MAFISFEGSEGCGKTTQIERLAARLRERGLSVAVFREPGGTTIGEAIRHLLQHSEQNRDLTPEAELLLFAASRAQLVREKIQPALQRGEWVICDRFLDSTSVYQGAARALDLDFLDRINNFAAADCRPTITFVLDLDREIAAARLSNRTVRDRMEEQSEEFYRAVERGYRALAKREPNRIILINGSRSIEEIANEIWTTVEQRLLSRH